MEHTGTFLTHPKLRTGTFLELFLQQCRLLVKIAPHHAAINTQPKPGVPSLVEQEKQVRKDMDALLVAAGLKSGDVVTIDGYDVTHRERAGQSAVNVTTAIERFVADGFDREYVEAVLAAATETADDVKFCEVKPSKGAKVKAPRAA